LEDVNKCVLALQERDGETLDRTAGAIRGRCARVCNVVSTEMCNYEPGPYTERVMEAVVVLRDQGLLIACYCCLQITFRILVKFMYKILLLDCWTALCSTTIAF